MCIVLLCKRLTAFERTSSEHMHSVQEIAHEYDVLCRILGTSPTPERVPPTNPPKDLCPKQEPPTETHTPPKTTCGTPSAETHTPLPLTWESSLLLQMDDLDLRLSRMEAVASTGLFFPTSTGDGVPP